ncbi:MAG: hypothetical protein E7C07_17215, partial [Enterobacter sp.]|nr:hypothetical protein [Enterobacter sp.]
FTNEGVVHELSWIPGVQTGRGLCAIPPGKGIDLRQKNRAKRKRLPARLFLMHFFAFKLQINHLVE